MVRQETGQERGGENENESYYVPNNLRSIAVTTYLGIINLPAHQLPIEEDYRPSTSQSSSRISSPEEKSNLTD